MSQNLSRCPEHLRGFFGKPFGEKAVVEPIRHNGQDWLALSDGRILLVAPDQWHTVVENAEHQKAIIDMLALPLKGPVIGTTVEALRVFSGPDPVPTLLSCRTCRGKGEHTCSCCEAEHECGTCNGTGQETRYPDESLGLVCEVRINRCRLARLLSFVSGQITVSSTRKGDVQLLCLTGPDWIGMVAGFSEPPWQVSGEECPVFSAS